MRNGRTWSLSMIGAAAALVLLLGTATLGLRLRSGSLFGHLPDAAPLDYGSAPFGAFSPLSPRFITDVLGGIVALPARTGDLAPDQRTRARAGQEARFDRVEIVHELTNDDRSLAREVPRVPFTARTDTRRATREPGEPSPCGALRGGTVWYRYTAPADTGLIANTFGSSYSTTLSVFSTGAQATNVGCDTDVQGDAIVQFGVRKGVTYLFQITGPAGGGDLVFSLDPEGVTTLVSTSPGGRRANAPATNPSVSGDGLTVAFESAATNLVAGVTNGTQGIYVHDRTTSATVLASASSTGRPANDNSQNAFMSGDGRYVTFESNATNLVPGDTNHATDVFVRDLRAGRTERISVSSEGAQAKLEPATEWGEATPDRLVYNQGSTSDFTMYPTMTPDGRYVAFQSRASNLVPGDHNHVLDVFVHDRVHRTTERASVSSAGRERGLDTSFYRNDNEDSMIPSISGNGRFVMFRTSAANLVAGDTNESHDIFVRDRKTHITERLSGTDTPYNLEDDDKPNYALNEIRPRTAISFDGRRVAFTASPRPTQGPTKANIFAYDRLRDRVVQANVSSTGAKDPNSSTRGAAVSADGRYIAFHSNAADLVPGDTNGVFDVFVRDLLTNTTVRLSSFTGASEAGLSCEAPSLGCGSVLPSMSSNGGVVAFEGSLGGVALPGAAQNQVYVNERPLPAS